MLSPLLLLSWLRISIPVATTASDKEEPWCGAHKRESLLRIMVGAQHRAPGQKGPQPYPIQNATGWGCSGRVREGPGLWVLNRVQEDSGSVPNSYNMNRNEASFMRSRSWPSRTYRRRERKKKSVVQNRCSECSKGLLKNVSGVEGLSVWRNMHFTVFWLSYLSQWPRASCYCNSTWPHRHLDNKLGIVAPRDIPRWCLRAACSGECLSGFNDVSSFKLNASGTSPA